MSQLGSRIKLAITATIVGLGSFAVVYVIVPKAAVPAQFLESRVRGAEIARAIVDQSNRTLTRLDEIAVYDREGNVAEALSAISQLVVDNRAAQEKVLALADELEEMARSIADIRPERARVFATEAVSSEVALVSHLLSYNDNLFVLFEALRAKFDNPSAKTNGRVRDLIGKINEEAQAINEFDGRFNDSLAEFDKLFQ